MGRKFFLLSLLLVLASAVPASDLMREQRIADDIEEAILVGESVCLKERGLVDKLFSELLIQIDAAGFSARKG
ncbi:hypothetical protein [Candidatus Vondammii sp. HM_W22]|uniref:hypothetical protein n=1 Tax=Candidatus Vondammii sp. HM_W22 TaxID=2687299 RepID=UPI002E7B3B80|nr:hypothetical protein [Candidatus Vondammii sp. HM_W22]